MAAERSLRSKLKIITYGLLDGTHWCHVACGEARGLW